MVERLHQFTETRRRKRTVVEVHHVYRGNPGCPEIIASCPTKEAADAARRLLSGRALKTSA